MAVSPARADADRRPGAVRVFRAERGVVFNLGVLHGSPVCGILYPCFTLVTARNSAEAVHSAH